MSGCYDSALYNTGEGSPWDQAADYKQKGFNCQLHGEAADTAETHLLITTRYQPPNKIMIKNKTLCNTLEKIWEFTFMLIYHTNSATIPIYTEL